MAPKRRTSTPATGQRNQQATITFGKQGHNRVTKPAAVQRDAKKTKKDDALIAVVSDRLRQPTTADAAIAQQAKAVELDLEPEQTARSKVGSASASNKHEDDEAQARRMTDSQIKKYWRNKEAERRAPRVHQQGLDITEKILREFDMSGQYGVSGTRYFLFFQTLTFFPALHWHRQTEAMEESKHSGPQSSCRGAGCAAQRGGQEQQQRTARPR